MTQVFTLVGFAAHLAMLERQVEESIQEGGMGTSEVEQNIVERNIPLGVDLLAMRNVAGSNREFSRMARRAFDIDPARAMLYARVARAYGDRRDITSRVNWKALVALATASEPVRLEFEERIVRGERIGAADIKRHR